MRLSFLALLATASQAHGALEFERTQLSSEHAKAFSAVDFGRADRGAKGRTPRCRAWPGSNDWPSAFEWTLLNATLDGKLLQPAPLTASCYRNHANYNAARCNYILTNATSDDFLINDPVNVLTHWTQGNTCLPAANATGTCSQGGFPVYVVNATTVKHVQAAVNFARNKNLRLVIKNTGHDFGGRSVGAGSLSIWTHYLEEFEFIRQYRKGNYSGPAAHFGSGMENWELFNHMVRNNVTIVGSGARSIGANGGWFASGGHGNLASLYGLAADQALEIHAVTADGRYAVADESQNTDLFYALRGGGGSTYAVVTSVVVKAYPPTTLSSTSLSIACNPPRDSDARARFAQLGPGTLYVNSTERFWQSLAVYFRFKQTIVDAGGTDWDYLYPLGNNSYSFRARITFPNVTAEVAANRLAPLFTNLARAGFNATLNRTELAPTPYAGPAITPPAASNGLSQTRYRSRLLPRANWASDALFNRTMAAIRATVQEGGYVLHGLSIGPTEKVAGYPGRTNAVNPAWRENVLHLCFMTTQATNFTAQQARDEEARIQRYMRGIREVSPGAGSYMNEGDPGEPDWQQAFYGSKYGELLRIKRRRDPWGVFWAATTVGSEGWEVVTLDGYPRSQNGRLCRVQQGGDH